MVLVKVCSHIRFLLCVRYCHQNNGEKMGLSPILSIIHTITTGTMLNFNCDNNRHGLKTVTCKQTLSDLKVSEIVEDVDGRFNRLMQRKRWYWLLRVDSEAMPCQTSYGAFTLTDSESEYFHWSLPLTSMNSTLNDASDSDTTFALAFAHVN